MLREEPLPSHFDGRAAMTNIGLHSIGAGMDEELVMITVQAKLVAQPGKEAEMQALLERMVAEVNAKEPGVAMYSMHTVEGSR